MKFDLIALDVDGTLLTDNHQLTAKTRDAVREAAGRGAEIVLCTGRGPGNTIPVLRDLGLTGTVITHNGAATIETASNRIVHQYKLDRAELAPFIAYCREQGHHFDVNTAFELLIERELPPEVAEMYDNYRIIPKKRKASDPLPPDLVKFTVFSNKDTMDTIERDWNGWTHQLQHIRSGDFFIDVQHPNASKGDALLELARLRGVDASRIMAIGNYYNDIGMLKAAGLGIAVANSPEKVKACADAVTSSNEEDGVANALYEYALL